ncbi:MAG: hypothetical protein JWO95_1566 [Verrucomicrobiales bacterium]|nr:hypothetical protein [Verrucomicrobiales bacterium]
MKILKSFAFVALTVASAQSLMACDICGCFDANGACGMGIGPSSKYTMEIEKGFIGGVAEQFTHFGTLQADGHRIDQHGEFINSSMSQVFALYNFNKRFGLQLNVPMIYREWGSDVMPHQHTSGIGDVSLVGNVRLYERLQQNTTLTWSLLGGVKVPTGNSSKLQLSDDDLPQGIGGHDLALGSGSFDGVVGTSVYGRWHRWFGSAAVQYAIRTRGDFGHRYANDLVWNGGPGYYVVVKGDYTIAMQAVVAGETKGKDNFYGVADEDSAETMVTVGPQVNLSWRNKLNVQLAADLPVSIDNTGEQVVPDYRLRAAVSWKFW